MTPRDRLVCLIGALVTGGILFWTWYARYDETERLFKGPLSVEGVFTAISLLFVFVLFSKFTEGFCAKSDVDDDDELDA